MGPDVGLGHQRRMEALGVALEALGFAIEAKPVGACPLRATVVIVDSYRIRADDPAEVIADVLIAVDDLKRDLAVDLLVDPSPGADPASHPQARVVLAGAAHALVGPGLPQVVSPPSDPVRRVLISTGGGTAGAALGAEIAGTVSAALPGLDTRLAVGPWTEIEPPGGVTAVRQVGGLGQQIAEADLVITAAGVTLLETLALGRPAVAMVVAENQRQAATTIAAAGAAIVVAPEDAAEAALELARDSHRRRALSEAAVSLIDRRGPSRVAAAVADLVGRSTATR